MVLQTECGLLLILNKNKIDFNFFISILKQLQHRGRETFGIGYSNINKNIIVNKYLGLVNISNVNNFILNYKSNLWIGHVRYSTSGKKIDSNNNTLFKEKALPLQFSLFIENDLTMIYNGNIPLEIWNKLFLSFNDLKEYYEKNDLTDSFLILKYISCIKKKYNKTDLDKDKIFLEILKIFLKTIDRCFCLAFVFNNNIWIIRDKYEVRPLCLGLNENNSSIIISSESASFKDSNYRLIGDVKGGSIIKINIDTLKIKELFRIENSKKKRCIFEYIYFMNENSISNNISVKDFRINLGIQLVETLKEDYNKLYTKFNKNPNILVCGIPNSGIISAKSIANILNIKYYQFINKNENSNRTFILDNNKNRINECIKKYKIKESDKILIENKILVLVDDSIVRGNTIKYLIDFIRTYNPLEIHFLVSSPPIVNICNYGVDFPDIEDLVAVKTNNLELGTKLNINSLTYLSKKKLENISNNYCLECFNN